MNKSKTCINLTENARQKEKEKKWWDIWEGLRAVYIHCCTCAGSEKVEREKNSKQKIFLNCFTHDWKTLSVFFSYFSWIYWAETRNPDTMFAKKERKRANELTCFKNRVRSWLNWHTPGAQTYIIERPHSKEKILRGRNFLDKKLLQATINRKSPQNKMNSIKILPFLGDVWRSHKCLWRATGGPRVACLRPLVFTVQLPNTIWVRIFSLSGNDRAWSDLVHD